MVSRIRKLATAFDSLNSLVFILGQYAETLVFMTGSICRDPFITNNRKVVKEWNVSPGVVRLVSYHRPVKETRICHPQICLLDIQFILSHRQLIVLQNKTKQKQTKNKTRKTPPKPKPILILLVIDLSAQRWHQRNLQTFYKQTCSTNPYLPQLGS